MNNGLILDAQDVKRILAEYFNVDESSVIKAQYSYIIIGGKDKCTTSSSQ